MCRNMVLYTINPKDSTPKFLESINEFINVAGYEINIQISVLFIYTNTELMERKMKKTIPGFLGGTMG